VSSVEAGPSSGLHSSDTGKVIALFNAPGLLGAPPPPEDHPIVFRVITGAAVGVMAPDVDGIAAEATVAEIVEAVPVFEPPAP
jgi:hypothetical protein